jgi:L-lactate dehydrogenase complex protein LldG
VREALRGSRTQSAVPPPPPVPALGAIDADPVSRLRRFQERLTAVGGSTHLALQPGQAAAAVAAILQEHGCASFGTSDSPLLAALLPALRGDGRRELTADAGRAALFDCEAGITSAQFGIAETGTLVLQHRQERHRLLSLLPPLHVCVLPVARVLSTLGQALATIERPLHEAVTLITGPSRTADIELKLVVGVHGPRALHVVLV